MNKVGSSFIRTKLKEYTFIGPIDSNKLMPIMNRYDLLIQNDNEKWLCCFFSWSESHSEYMKKVYSFTYNETLFVSNENFKSEIRHLIRHSFVCDAFSFQWCQKCTNKLKCTIDSSAKIVHSMPMVFIQ